MKRRPGTGPGAGPGTGPGAGPGACPGTGPGTSPGTGPGTGPGTSPGTGPDAGPGAGQGTRPSMQTGGSLNTVDVPGQLNCSNAVHISICRINANQHKHKSGQLLGHATLLGYHIRTTTSRLDVSILYRSTKFHLKSQAFAESKTKKKYLKKAKANFAENPQASGRYSKIIVILVSRIHREVCRLERHVSATDRDVFEFLTRITSL